MTFRPGARDFTGGFAPSCVVCRIDLAEQELTFVVTFG